MAKVEVEEASLHFFREMQGGLSGGEGCDECVSCLEEDVRC